MTAAAAAPSLDPLLRRAEHLVAAASLIAVALEDLSIELPPSQAGAVDQAQLRAIAALYLAAQLEAAGLMQAAEDLVGLARTGALGAQLDAVAPLIEAFWQGRRQRATRDERESFFAGLFGEPGIDPSAHPPNAAFEDGLIDLCEALYKLDEAPTNRTWGGVAQQARVRGAAERVLDNLGRRAGSITAFMAKEILATVRQAIAILNHQNVHAAVGARTVAEVIPAVARLARRDEPGAFSLYVRRGDAGMTVITWLAEAAPSLRSNRPLLAIDHPVIAAAIEWLESSLKLTESTPPASRRPVQRPPSQNAESDWAALAG